MWGTPTLHTLRAHAEPAGATSKPTSTTLQPGCGAPPPPHTTLAGRGEAGKALTRAVAVGAAAARRGVQRGRRGGRHGAELRLVVSPATPRLPAARAGKGRRSGGGRRCHAAVTPTVTPLCLPEAARRAALRRLIWDGWRRRALNRVNKACMGWAGLLLRWRRCNFIAVCTCLRRGKSQELKGPFIL